MLKMQPPPFSDRKVKFETAEGTFLIESIKDICTKDMCIQRLKKGNICSNIKCYAVLVDLLFVQIIKVDGAK